MKKDLLLMYNLGISKKMWYVKLSDLKFQDIENNGDQI